MRPELCCTDHFFSGFRFCINNRIWESAGTLLTDQPSTPLPMSMTHIMANNTQTIIHTSSFFITPSVLGFRPK